MEVDKSVVIDSPLSQFALVSLFLHEDLDSSDQRFSISWAQWGRRLGQIGSQPRHVPRSLAGLAGFAHVFNGGIVVPSSGDDRYCLLRVVLASQGPSHNWGRNVAFKDARYIGFSSSRSQDNVNDWEIRLVRRKFRQHFGVRIPTFILRSEAGNDAGGYLRGLPAQDYWERGHDDELRV